MKISVVIVAHNAYDEVEYAIQSILEQEPGDYELDLVLVDNGSTDKDRTITKLRDKMVLLNNKGIKTQVTGAYKTTEDNSIWLFGANCTAGDWICFLPATSFYYSNYLKNLVLTINKYYSNKDIILSQYKISKIDKTKYHQQIYDPSIWRDKERQCLAGGSEVRLSSFLSSCFRKSIIQRLYVGSEHEMWLYILDKNLKLSYANIEAGVEIIGEKLDKRKRKALFAELYLQPRY